MGVRKMTITICDNCERDRPVSKWRISHAGSAVTVDLCLECSIPLARLVDEERHGDLFEPVDDDVIARARERRDNLDG